MSFDRFWRARSKDERAAAGAEIAASGVSFDAALAALKAGRPRPGNPPTGIVRGSRRDDDLEFFYAVNVPDDYDPARRYPLRIHLHGGVTVPEDNLPRGNGSIGALAGTEPHIYVLPSGWADAPWWSPTQIANLRAIVDAVKQTYNVDDNRVSLSGVSDGGTGGWFVALRDPTPYAGFVSLIGSLLALRNRALVKDDLFPNNLRNRPFYVVNGGRDQLYPAAALGPILRHLQQTGVSVDYHPQPNAGHEVSWWPEVRGEVDAFLRAHVRSPLPETLTWEAGEAATDNRAHWLRIDAVRPGKERRLDDVNLMPMPPTREFGVMAVGTRLATVVNGSSAARIGLQRGDRLLAINGVAAAPDEDVDQLLTRCCTPERPIAIAVLRGDTRVDLNGMYQPAKIGDGALRLFDARRPSGRVDLAKTGNVVRAETSGVAAFTLLLSPDAFDFTKPVSVIVNGRPTIETRIEPSVRTLMKWAAEDNDQTMLFGQELTISVS